MVIYCRHTKITPISNIKIPAVYVDMLYLIGIGLKPKQITHEALEILKECNEVYLETYTSVYSEGEVEELEEMIGKSVIAVDRNEVELKFDKIIESAKEKDVALAVFGNALSATTHAQILIDAKNAKIETKVFPGISIMNYLGKTGLSEYKFGRTTTLVYPQENYAPESFYDIIKENKLAGLHTLCLLDIDVEKKLFMSVKDAIELLEDIEIRHSENIMKKSLLIAICAAGSDKEKIVAGSSEELKKLKLPRPASLIVCGKLSEKEEEALAIIYGVNFYE
ncbi:MAG: diphthine synthase [Candidatus Diapherotrites archaeon]